MRLRDGSVVQPPHIKLRIIVINASAGVAATRCPAAHSNWFRLLFVIFFRQFRFPNVAGPEQHLYAPNLNATPPSPRRTLHKKWANRAGIRLSGLHQVELPIPCRLQISFLPSIRLVCMLKQCLLFSDRKSTLM